MALWSPNFAVAVDVNAYVQMVELDTSKPSASDMYYATCRSVDQHNRRRCDDIKSEKNSGTQSWDIHVNMSIVGVSVVNS